MHLPSFPVTISVLAALTHSSIALGCGGGGAGPVERATDAGQDGGSTAVGCVNVDTSSLAVSCSAASDCTTVATQVCDGKMDCGNFAINRSALAAYNAQIAGVNPIGCLAFTAPPTCVQNRCVATK
jgi:hypothetical protein